MDSVLLLVCVYVSVYQKQNGEKCPDMVVSLEE